MKLLKIGKIKSFVGQNYKVVLISLAIFVGFVFCLNVGSKDVLENLHVEYFENQDASGVELAANPMKQSQDPRGFNPGKDCPNVLIKDGKRLYLYNNNRAKVPGVNPMIFDNLEEYAEYMAWLRKMGRNCPVLYLQKTIDAQGKLKLKTGHAPFNERGGLNHVPPVSEIKDATDQSDGYNKNMYQGVDFENQNVGLYTPLDKMYHSNKRQSSNPMDSNWGGKKFSEKLANEINVERGEMLADTSNFKIEKKDPYA